MVVSTCKLEELILQNSSLIHSICSKNFNYFDKEDLYQEGVIGLIKAYNNFDANKEVKFSTYAFPYIVGEVNEYIRKNKAIKISKDLVRLGRKINEYINKHLEVRGFEPSVDDIAEMLDISKEKVISALEACNMAKSKSLNEEINDEGKAITLLDKVPVKENISKEQMLDLKEAFKYLSDEEKVLIINRYFNNLTQSEVAELLNVNQVYVSRLEKKALTKMKRRMVS